MYSDLKNKGVEGLVGGITDWIDRRLEAATRKLGSALWREMKQGAEKPFSQSYSDGTAFITALTDFVADKGDIEVFACGHSTGAIFHAHCFNRWDKLNVKPKIEKLYLMAPAINYSLFHKTFTPLLKNGLINDSTVFNLSGELELDDNVGYVYRKSLLYLVSNAFEENTKEPLVGMEYFNNKEPSLGNKVKFIYSGRSSNQTKSISHGGFDNDPVTMNSILSDILGAEPTKCFTKKSLDY